MSRTLAKLVTDGRDLERRLYVFWQDLSQGIPENEARGVKTFEYDAWCDAARQAVITLASPGSKARNDWESNENELSNDREHIESDQDRKVLKLLNYLRGQLKVIQTLSYQHPDREEVTTVNEYNTVNVVNNSGIIAVKSTLNRVAQTVRDASLPDARKKEFQALIEELKSALQSVPPEKADDAELVAEQAERVSDELTKENPRVNGLKISSKGLLEAAKSIADVVPIALDVARKIAVFVSA